MEYALLAGAGIIAGIMNAVAGGGSFITFPAMVFLGMPPINANASNTVALFPGNFASAWAYRRDFTNFEGVAFRSLAVVGLAGGMVGAFLLLRTPAPTFDAIIPWLLLAATLIFVYGPRVTPYLQKRFHIGPGALLTIQFAVGIYGGYFGGAMGIVMLAVYSLFGLTNLNAMNATKTLMAGLINGIAVVIFVAADIVWWPQTLVMMVGAVTGGYLGAHVARGMNQGIVRAIIIAISVGVTIAFFARAL